MIDLFDYTNIIIIIVIIAAMLILAAIIAPKKEKIIKIKSVDKLFETIDPHVLKCKKCHIIISTNNRNYHIKKYHEELMK